MSREPTVIAIEPSVAERLERAHTRAGGYSEAIEHAFRDGVLAGFVEGRRGDGVAAAVKLKRFWSCENMCPCDEYVVIPFDDWINMVSGGSGPHLWCPHCDAPCDGVLIYPAPPEPYDVDGDGWIFRAILPDEVVDWVALERGFVSEDGKRLYLHGIEFDPRRDL